MLILSYFFGTTKVLLSHYYYDIHYEAVNEVLMIKDGCNSRALFNPFGFHPSQSTESAKFHHRQPRH